MRKLNLPEWSSLIRWMALLWIIGLPVILFFTIVISVIVYS